MRKIIVILGILLTVTILISGLAVATWTYVDNVIDEEYTTNPGNIVGTPVSGTEATLGQNAPTQVLGWILVDLGSGHAMPPNQDFTVFAGSSESEQYSVYLLLTLTPNLFI